MAAGALCRRHNAIYALPLVTPRLRQLHLHRNPATPSHLGRAAGMRADSPSQFGQHSYGSARSSAPQPRPSRAQGSPSSPDGGSSAVDALTDSMHSVSFSSPDPKLNARSSQGPRRRVSRKPGPDDLEGARARTIYVSDLSKGITETELVRWFGVAGHVLECRICSDMNTSRRFAFVEFADQEGFEQGACFACGSAPACTAVASCYMRYLCWYRSCSFWHNRYDFQGNLSQHHDEQHSSQCRDCCAQETHHQRDCRCR